MRRLLFIPATVVILFASACSAPTPTPPPPAAPEFRPTFALRDVMHSIVEPNADFIWNAVATVSTEKGVEEHFPKTDDEWDAVRHHAISLIETTNLILVPGRAIKAPNDNREEDPTQLKPEEIEALQKSDPKAWTDHAHALYDATMVTMKAIDAKDVDALLQSGEGIDKACEDCHLKYWYPNEGKLLQEGETKGETK